MELHEIIRRLQNLESRFGNVEVNFTAFNGDRMTHLTQRDLYAAVPPDGDGNDGGAVPCEIYWDFTV